MFLQPSVQRRNIGKDDKPAPRSSSLLHSLRSSTVLNIFKYRRRRVFISFQQCGADRGARKCKLEAPSNDFVNAFSSFKRNNTSLKCKEDAFPNLLLQGFGDPELLTSSFCSNESRTVRARSSQLPLTFAHTRLALWKEPNKHRIEPSLGRFSANCFYSSV